MTERGRSPEREVILFLTSLAATIARERQIFLAGRILLVSQLLALVFLGARGLGADLRDTSTWLISIGGVGVASLVFLRRPPDPGLAASALDAGLPGRFTTALECALRGAANPLEAALLDDVALDLSRRTTSRLTRRGTRGELWAGGALMAILFGFLFAPLLHSPPSGKRRTLERVLLPKMPTNPSAARSSPDEDGGGGESDSSAALTPRAPVRASPPRRPGSASGTAGGAPPAERGGTLDEAALAGILDQVSRGELSPEDLLAQLTATTGGAGGDSSSPPISKERLDQVTSSLSNEARSKARELVEAFRQGNGPRVKELAGELARELTAEGNPTPGARPVRRAAGKGPSTQGNADSRAASPPPVEPSSWSGGASGKGVSLGDGDAPPPPSGRRVPLVDRGDRAEAGAPRESASFKGGIPMASGYPLNGLPGADRPDQVEGSAPAQTYSEAIRRYVHREKVPAEYRDIIKSYFSLDR